MHYFNTLILEEANRFLRTLHPQAIDKIFYNMGVAAQTNDPRLLKKIHQHIWELRQLIMVMKFGCLPFGTSQIQKTRW
ncbi:hypothetical protein J2Y45_000525 [Dyadobacter sp. BE34]|uniref:Uncharacterized protein n=1 Tax=Dyadobacter fermentans TaxID=94254 RepID=A0ABU1QR40_9BACT|nr:hypothetical protein [Dyadobacter fermentans]MDR7040996.1 hypothetical protein [Dyadobacter sp. BE242]MDR7195399.1 hypothetical protein [Dyadobacter sp. BE34]MDR7214056.1 hypothetical protein [Dyadobacter sp. BE31]MDR7260806.1 hypothetical protein [Dyadobacter sp. BE32]